MTIRKVVEKWKQEQPVSKTKQYTREVHDCEFENVIKSLEELVESQFTFGSTYPKTMIIMRLIGREGGKK